MCKGGGYEPLPNGSHRSRSDIWRCPEAASIGSEHPMTVIRIQATAVARQLLSSFKLKSSR